MAVVAAINQFFVLLFSFFLFLREVRFLNEYDSIKVFDQIALENRHFHKVNVEVRRHHNEQVNHQPVVEQTLVVELVPCVKRKEVVHHVPKQDAGKQQLQCRSSRLH